MDYMEQATGFLSMWVSNTATAVVMLPIGLSIVMLTADIMGGVDKLKNFSTALMLGIAYSVSIGSLGTIIGTPPNALLQGYLQESHDIVIGFGRWMMVGVPLAVVFIPIILKRADSDLVIADAAIGMAAAMLLFMVPTRLKKGVRLIDWATASKLPWDVLLLFGGGLALSKMFSESGFWRPFRF